MTRCVLAELHPFFAAPMLGFHFERVDLEMNPFILIAENKIREAMENGEFENLSGQGEPIDLSEDEYIPAEYRIAYRIMKNSGHDKAEADLLRQIRALKDEAETLTDDSKSEAVTKLINSKEAELLARRNRHRVR